MDYDLRDDQGVEQLELLEYGDEPASKTELLTLNFEIARKLNGDDAGW